VHNNTDLPPYNNLPKHTADGSGMHRSTAHSEDTTKKKDASLKDLEAYLLQDCSAAEADHRRKTLQAIEEKLRHEPYHSAADHPDRARQFMPFAALKGYDALIEQTAAGTAPAFQKHPSNLPEAKWSDDLDAGIKHPTSDN